MTRIFYTVAVHRPSAPGRWIPFNFFLSYSILPLARNNANLRFRPLFLFHSPYASLATSASTRQLLFPRVSRLPGCLPTSIVISLHSPSSFSLHVFLRLTAFLIMSVSRRLAALELIKYAYGNDIITRSVENSVYLLPFKNKIPLS